MRNSFCGILIALSFSSVAQADPTFDRNSWTHWNGQWDGNFWKSGSFDNSQYMTCVGTDGSIHAAEYWTAGMGEDAARDACNQVMSHIGPRNPAYVEVWCGY